MGNDLNLIFNYRLSRARRVIENTFVILASRFRRSIIGKAEKAAVILHNFLVRKSTRNMYCPLDYVDQEMSGCLLVAGVMKPLKVKDWLASEHKVLIILQELQKKCEMISKITPIQKMVKSVRKEKLSRVLQVCLMMLIEANNSYILYISIYCCSKN